MSVSLSPLHQIDYVGDVRFQVDPGTQQMRAFTETG
jgi:hypothetical protein